MSIRSLIPAPLIVVEPAPAPWIVMSRVMSRSPVVAASSNWPVTDSVWVPEPSVMDTGSIVLLAAITASRSEMLPSVPRLASSQLTVCVALPATTPASLLSVMVVTVTSTLTPV